MKFDILMDREKAKLPIEGKVTPPYPRLLFFCTRVLPIAFAAGAVQIALLNYFYPMSEEERQELMARRSGKGNSSGRVRPSMKKSDSAATTPVNPYTDDTGLLTNEHSQPLDLSHLRIDQVDPPSAADTKELSDENTEDGRSHRSFR